MYATLSSSVYMGWGRARNRGEVYNLFCGVRAKVRSLPLTLNPVPGHFYGKFFTSMECLALCRWTTIPFVRVADVAEANTWDVLITS